MTRRVRSVHPCSRSDGDESGSSVVELLVAAGLTVTAFGVLLGNVIVPLGHLARTQAPDIPSIELRIAGEEVARLVRAARPGVVESAVVADGDRAVVVRLTGSGSAEHIRISLLADTLELERRDANGALVGGSRRTLVSGLVPDAGRFIVHHDPVSAAMGRADVVAVEFQLVGATARIERTVAIRLSSHLDGAGGW